MALADIRTDYQLASLMVSRGVKRKSRRAKRHEPGNGE
ncbi:MAG: hypothetical protein K0R08_410 [Solimicrobium sp.]|nr:hypothetical protein [Solimicrobium sp.]